MISQFLSPIGWESPWLLAAMIPVAGVALWLILRTASPLPSWRRVLGGAGLMLCLLSALAAAGGLFWHGRGDGRTVWILVDRSLSVGDAAERRLAAVLRDLVPSLGEGDFIGVIGFSDNAQVLLPPTAPGAVNADIRLPRAEMSDETWLVAALELAARSTVPDTEGMAILLGDGHDSALRYGLDLQREVRQAGMRLYTMPVDSLPSPEAAIVDFHARLAGEDRTVIALDLVLFSTVPQTLAAHVKLNGEPAAAMVAPLGTPNGPIRVGVGRTPLRLLVTPSRRLATYVVEVSLAAEQNSYPGNDSLKLAVRGPGDARVLMLHGPAGPERALQRALQRAGVDVVTGDAGLMPSEAVELAQYQALLLCDVPSTDLSPRQSEIISRFVRGGGGLAMIGGPHSFAPGGYYESAIERVLPVTCDVVEKGRKNKPALLLVLDRSGSMGAMVGGRTKMELANEGCVRTIQLASPTSLFGMLSVDTAAHWIVPMGPLVDRTTATARARGNDVGGGGIYTDVAMREALQVMARTEASSRHIVLFSDGDDTERQEGVLEMVQQAVVHDKITVSTICLGRGRDWGFLQQLAIAGNGRAFLVEDASQLPAVFSREAALSGGNFLREDPFQPWPGLPGSLTHGVDFRAENSPPLLGYVATTARPESHVWLWADEERERPLLATWNVELGRAMAFTSDARDRWAQQWLPWDQYDEMWQRWVRWLLPQPEAALGVESEWSMSRQGPALTLRFFDDQGAPRALEDPEADLTTPDGSTISPVVPVGSGTYRVQFTRGGAGIYAASVRERPAGQEERLAAREFQVVMPLDELLRRSADDAGLASLAAATGGSIVTDAAAVGEVAPRGAQTTVLPTQWLLWLSALGMLLGIGARRLPSVWTRRDEAKSTQAETQTLSTARDAMERVRKSLQNREPPPPARPGVQVAARASASPAPAAAPAAAADHNTLLSAVRKVRKQVDRPGDDA